MYMSMYFAIILCMVTLSPIISGPGCSKCFSTGESKKNEIVIPSHHATRKLVKKSTQSFQKFTEDAYKKKSPKTIFQESLLKLQTKNKKQIPIQDFSPSFESSRNILNLESSRNMSDDEESSSRSTLIKLHKITQDDNVFYDEISPRNISGAHTPTHKSKFHNTSTPQTPVHLNKIVTFAEIPNTIHNVNEKQ